MLCNKVIITLSLLTTSSVVLAQLTNTDAIKKQLTVELKDTVAWVKTGQFNLGLNQGFLHNWASGGEVISLQVHGLFSGNATHINYNKIWSSDLLLAYGLHYQYSNKFVPRKVDDRIDLSSRYGIRLQPDKKWYAMSLINFRTQFTAGFDYNQPNWQRNPISEFLSPAYLMAALGLEHKGEHLSIFISPAAARFTFADAYYTRMFPEGAFGIENNETMRFELGAHLSARFNREWNKKVSFRSRLDLYSNYLAKDKVENGVLIKADNPGNVDVLFDNHLGIKLGNFISVAVGLTTIYDNDLPYHTTYLDPVTGIETLKEEPGTSLGWVQVNQLLNIGFTYKF